MAPSLPSPSTPNPSALRELALRSMKPKRKPTDQPDARKPSSLQTNISHLPRLIPPPKDTLDYGEPMDVDSKSPTSPASAASSTRPGLSRLGSIRLRATGQAPTALLQESKDREEGEISEEEIRGKKQEEKPKLPKKRAGKKQQNDVSAGDKQEGLHTLASTSTSSATPLAQPQSSRPLATPDATMVEAPTSGLVAGTNRPKVPPLQTVSRVMTPLQPLPRQDELSPATQRLNQEVLEKLAHYQAEIDEAHCRPGLPMRFEEYEEAKGLILDLLGFGMSPEDLIDTNVSKRLVVYCMREMNLRIPFNVDLSDIVPYEPPPILPLTSPSPEATEPSPTDTPTQPGQPPSTLPPPTPTHEVPPRPPDVVKLPPRQRRPTQSHPPYNNQSDRAPHTGYPPAIGTNQSGGPPPAFPPDVPYGSFGKNHPINQKAHNITHMNGYPPIPQHMPILPLHMGISMGMPMNYGVDYQTPSPTTTHQHSNLPRPPFLPNRPEPSTQNHRASSGHTTTSTATAGPSSAASTTAPPSDPTAARQNATETVDPNPEVEAQEKLRQKEAEIREALRARQLKKKGEQEAEVAIQNAIASLDSDTARDSTPRDTNELTTPITDGLSSAPMDYEHVPYVPQAHTSSLDAKLLHPMAAGHTPPPDTGSIFSSVPTLTSILRDTSSTNTEVVVTPELRPASRRGVKRPTADDFIDDSGPNKRVHLDNGRASGSSDVSVTGLLYKRSTTTSFTQFNATLPERVVIHLSEDDEEGGDTDDRDTEMRECVTTAPPSRTETPQEEPAVDQRKSELQEKLRLMKELLQKKEAERKHRLRSGSVTESPTPNVAAEATTASIGITRSLTSERNGTMVSTPDSPNSLPDSSLSTEESTPVPPVESPQPQPLSTPPPATSSSVTTISPLSPKREVIEIDDSTDEENSDDDVIIIEPPVKVVLPPTHSSSFPLPTRYSDSPSQPGGVSQPPLDMLSQDSEAHYVPPSMLTAFTQHPLPSDFSRSSPIVPHTNSAGPSRSQDFAVDLTPLQNSIMQRLDPRRLLCRFESSGAGKCQDRHCEDYHWSDLEPSDDVLAQFLLESDPGLANYNHGEIKGVIQSTRTLNATNMGFSASATASDLQGLTDLVKQALWTLPPR